MTNNILRLPPLRALIAFEAAARYQNFTRASEELLVSRVAISRQIKLLDEHLGVALFHRDPRRLSLTPAGEQLYAAVRDSLENIESASEAIRRLPSRPHLRVKTTPAASIYWLMPRIARFRQRCPEVDFSIESSLQLSELRRDGTEVAIRYGSGRWKAMKSELLTYQSVFPTCSPAYFARRARPKRPEDLLHENLIHLDTAFDEGHQWPAWFRSHGVRYVENHRQIRLTDYSNLVRCLLDGQGIGLAGPPILELFYRSGQLIPAIDAVPTRLQGFYLVWPESAVLKKATQSFVDWVLQEMREPPDPQG